jgi:carbamoyl-phosphate synthase large subunit
MSDVGPGTHMVDKFIRIPSADASGYADILYLICKENNIDLIIPKSDEEAIELSKHKAKFDVINTVIMTNEYDTHMLAADKGNFLNHIKDEGLPCAEFRIPKSILGLQNAAAELGYPHKPVVMKPRLGRGNRGMRIIQNKLPKGDLLLNHKPGTPFATLEDIVSALQSPEVKKFPDIVLMEYLPGKEYSVDVLIKDGTVLYAIPKVRVMPAPGLSVIGQVEMNPDVIKAVKDICSKYNFNHIINIQFRYSEDGKLYPYEINSRVAASIGACHAAGVNLLYLGIKNALGEDIDQTLNVKDGVKMIRYYKELYI